MQIHFTKMQSFGNDFMIIDGVRQNFQPNAKSIQQWANRHTGVGFDQLLLVEARRSNQADYFYRIFNADGREVAQCGNGARCMAQFLHDKKLATQNLLRLETINGSVEVRIEADGQITANLGRPLFAPKHIPFVSDTQTKTYTLKLTDQTVEFCALSLGNPHCVIQVNNIDNAPVATLGPQLARHAAFPESVNVSFMQILDNKHIRLRVFERGVGETLACGSGACAAVVAGRLLNLLNETVTVEQPGGSAIVSWAGEQSPVYLTGPVFTVFNGEIPS